jgi:phosphopantetheinyl transferase (holo-ACP synthase)
VTTSLTWTFSSCRDLVSCGIDSERISRFHKFKTGSPDFMPFVFSGKERDYCATLENPGQGLCASFCVKEAMFKAIRRPYNFTDCEFFYAPTPEKARFALTGSISRAIRDMVPCVKVFKPAAGQFTAIIYLFGAA